MGVEISENCKKFKLPNGKIVDILSDIFIKMKKWTQEESDRLEAGGYVVGYKHLVTGNITLEDISEPYIWDKRNRIYFKMKDFRHKLFLARKKNQKSFYMGTWHTHPQRIPEPSSIDWENWYGSLEVDRTGCEYMFFIIEGMHEIRIWVGDLQSRTIIEISECSKENGIYLS